MIMPAVLGAAPEGQRLLNVRASPNFRDGAFQNPVPTSMMAPGGMLTMLRRQFGGKEERAPRGVIPLLPLTRASYDAPPESGLRLTWLGHSTTLIEIDGFRVLVDPVFGKRVSPTRFAGPRRFHPPPLPLTEMPTVDAIIITHDHYDHLDMAAVRTLARSPLQTRVQWITALGVGAHLEHWGIKATRISELDWGDSARVGDLTITAQPARHFSGRGTERNQTLWASWVIAGPSHRIFHSGDTGFFEGLARIGAVLGPFDLSMIKIGAYDPLWPDIHLNPEEALRVHTLISGGVLVPIHWGTFNLAFHAWNEPPDRLLAAAEGSGVRIAIPRPGQFVEPAMLPALDMWWRAVR